MYCSRDQEKFISGLYYSHGMKVETGRGKLIGWIELDEVDKKVGRNADVVVFLVLVRMVDRPSRW